jgi:hypothetical protein
MPAIGNENEELVWPAWSMPSARFKVNKWPRANTKRTTALLRSLFWTEMFPMSSQVLLKFIWHPDPPLLANFQWYWSEVVMVGNLMVFESGLNSNGHSCRFIGEYLENLSMWPGRPGFQFISTMRLAGVPEVNRIHQHPGWPDADPSWPGGILSPAGEWDHKQVPEYGSSPYPQPFPNRVVALILMADEWPLDQLTTAP